MLAEPTFEEYELDSSVYIKYWEEVKKLENELTARKADLKRYTSSVAFILALAALYCLVFWALFSSLKLFLGSDSSAGFAGISFWVAAFIIAGIHEYIANFVSFGRLNRAKKQSKELEDSIWNLKEETRKKVFSFEKAARDYFGAEINQFYYDKLYKKWSGTPEFNNTLSEFSSMIDDISGMNSVFLTGKVSLGIYKDYLAKRSKDQSFQEAKRNQEHLSTHDFSKRLYAHTTSSERKIHAPHVLYRTAQKIDNWEEINKRRKITGQKGEEIVVSIEQEYFESINRKDLSDKVRHVAFEDGDGLGFDVLSFFDDGREKYIEVKSTTAYLSAPFYLSRNELSFLQEHLEDSFIYRVLVTEEYPQIEVHISSKILETDEITPIQYLVRTK